MESEMESDLNKHLETFEDHSGEMIAAIMRWATEKQTQFPETSEAAKEIANRAFAHLERMGLEAAQMTEVLLELVDLGMNKEEARREREARKSEYEAKQTERTMEYIKQTEVKWRRKQFKLLED
jgi:hypothetical protein